MRNSRAGLPTTSAPSCSDLNTTMLEPTIALSPFIRPGRLTASPQLRPIASHMVCRYISEYRLVQGKGFVDECQIRGDRDSVFKAQVIHELYTSLHRDTSEVHQISFNEVMFTDVAMNAYCGTP